MSSESQLAPVRSCHEPAPMMSNGFLVLYLGVTPYQNEQLCLGLPAEPDEYSNRFGMRTTARSAILRAHYFMEWTPLGGRGECTLADMKAYKVVLSPDGFEIFVEEGVQVVLRRILNEPCSWNLKFNGVLLKPWMSLQCSGSYQSWM